MNKVQSNYDMSTRDKAHMACDLNVIVQIREFSRSQAVTFTSKVVVSKNGVR